MAVIKITNMGGVYPSVLPRNLQADGAQVAQNLQSRTSEFRPLATDATVATLPFSSPGGLYRASRNANGSLNTDPSQGWRPSVKVINVVRGQINDNLTDRNYYTIADGSQPPRVGDVLGNDRQLGVPAPTTAPSCTVKEGYTFTPEQRVTEVRAALHKVVNDVLNGGVSEAYAGINILPTDAGWVKVAHYSPHSPDALRYVWRVFAVNPATDKLISTYSAMPVDQAGWVFDPALGGEYVVLPPGTAAPSWAQGHTKWWAVKLRAYFRALDINAAAAKAALLAVDLPGSQGSKKWLTDADATAIVARLSDALDKDDPKVAPLIDSLIAAQVSVGNLFNQGGATTLTASIKDFYARPDVLAAIETAKDVYAAQIWQYAEQIAKATAPPYYESPGDTGA